MEQLERLLNRDSNLSIVSDGAGTGRCILASQSLAAGEIIGPAHGLAVRSVLDPVEILRDQRVGRTIVEALGAGDSRRCAVTAAEEKRGEEMAFWMAVAAMAREAEARRQRRRDADRARPHKRTKTRAQQEQEAVVDAYLLSLPRDGPDPCCWNEAEREELLAGTPLSKQIDTTIQQVKKTYNEVMEKLFAEHDGLEEGEFEQLPPFSILGRGKFPSVLWARSMHQSRSFPRALVDEALYAFEGVWWQGRKKYTPPLESGESGGDAGDGNTSTILSVRLGGHRAPRITVQKEPPPPPDSTSARPPGSTLGIMIPLFDMLDHKSGHAVQWEAATDRDNQHRCIRFRCVEAIAQGQPVWNNYGPKGNGELLATYGFATRENVLDSVDGIVLGLRVPSAPLLSPSPECVDDNATECNEERQVFKAQLELIRARALPHRFEENDGRVLLLGPFSLHRKLRTNVEGSMHPNSEESDSSSGGVIPQELYHALSVMGMEEVEEGPIISVTELEILKEVLTQKMVGFGRAKPGSAERSPSGELRRQFVEAYKEGQRQVLQLALAELESLIPR